MSSLSWVSWVVKGNRGEAHENETVEDGPLLARRFNRHELRGLGTRGRQLYQKVLAKAADGPHAASSRPSSYSFSSLPPSPYPPFSGYVVSCDTDGGIDLGVNSRVVLSGSAGSSLAEAWRYCYGVNGNVDVFARISAPKLFKVDISNDYTIWQTRTFPIVEEGCAAAWHDAVGLEKAVEGGDRDLEAAEDGS